MQQIPEKIDSKFRFVLLASQRAEQMMRGAQPKVDKPGVKQTRLAMHEILEDAVSWDYGAAPEEAAADALADGALGDDAAAAEEAGTES